MLLAHSSALVFMSERGLDFFLFSNKSTAHYNFPVGTIAHLDVIDSEVFAKSLTQFVESFQVASQDFVLLLAPQVVFKKEFVYSKDLKEDELKQNFSKILPFAKSNLSFIQVESKENIQLLATPTALYMLIVETLEALKWKNEKVVPFQLIDEIALPLDPESAKEALKQSEKSRKSFSTSPQKSEKT